MLFKSKRAIWGQVTENTPIFTGVATLNLGSLYFEKKMQQLKMMLKKGMDNRGAASNPKVTRDFLPEEEDSPVGTLIFNHGQGFSVNSEDRKTRRWRRRRRRGKRK